MLIVGLVCVMISPFLIEVFGESREECVQINNTKLLMLSDKPDSAMFIGDCDWLVTEILDNSEFEFSDYEYTNGVTQWIFTK